MLQWVMILSDIVRLSTFYNFYHILKSRQSKLRDEEAARDASTVRLSLARDARVSLLDRIDKYVFFIK